MDEYFMRQAYIEAEKAKVLGEVPVGAVIVRENSIVARGYNLKENTKDATAHAEIMAIKGATSKLGGWRLIDCTMYVTLEPCIMCAGAILNSRLDRLVIGTRDERMGACGSNINLLNLDNNNHSVEVLFGILEDKCSNILSDFFKELRREKR